MPIYNGFSLEVIAWMCIAEGGVNVALLVTLIYAENEVKN